VREAFGFGASDLFAALDAAPVASGSIGQVHRAVLSDTGARLTGMKPGERRPGRAGLGWAQCMSRGWGWVHLEVGPDV
jgi:predicted unusual protein kinase regulating ubiquinone biosynthesis (AarF/ABC1/UbiB family)